MIKNKTKILVVAAVALAVELSGCKKEYTCYSYQSDYVVCTLGIDTVRYFVSGFSDREKRVKDYYEGLGYVCNKVPYYIVGAVTYSEVFTEKDAKYLESQGFSCYEKKP